MWRSIAGTVLAAYLGFLAHSQSAKVEFEVASIKPSAPPGHGPIRLGRQGGPGTGEPGRITYAFTTIRDLIVEAYSIRRSQVSGPNSLDAERFDIVAKAPESATKEEVKVMLQNLLAERFKLTLHRETRDMPMYALVVGSKGAKLKDSTVADTPPASDSQASGPPAPRPGRGGMKMGSDGCPETPRIPSRPTFTMITPNGECMISSGQTMEGLAKLLSNRFDGPVVDQTGLTGKYDLRLRYDPASLPGGRGAPIGKDIHDEPGARPDGGDPDGGPPSIFSALQQQLGLKLEAKKGPVELLVIDHVEKMPTAN